MLANPGQQLLADKIEERQMEREIAPARLPVGMPKHHRDERRQRTNVEQVIENRRRVQHARIHPAVQQEKQAVWFSSARIIGRRIYPDAIDISQLRTVQCMLIHTAKGTTRDRCDPGQGLRLRHAHDREASRFTIGTDLTAGYVRELAIQRIGLRHSVYLEMIGRAQIIAHPIALIPEIAPPQVYQTIASLGLTQTAEQQNLARR